MKAKQLAFDYFDPKTKHEFHFPINLFKKPENLREYKKLEKLLDQLIDEVRDNELHPLSQVMQIIGDNLERFDSEYYPEIGSNISPVRMVTYLMKTQGLLQKDLAPIFGGQANVSKFLNGERTLTKNQIKGLRERFGISADFFV